MPTLYRRLYRLLLRLHPAAFRSEFARDMALDFEDALATYGLARLFLDVTRSLARQWTTQLISPSAAPAQTPAHPLLAGNYAQILDEPLRPLELARGFFASGTLLAFCSFAMSVGHGRIPQGYVVYAAPTKSTVFDVVSIREDKSISPAGTEWNVTPDGYHLKDAPVFALIQGAFVPSQAVLTFRPGDVIGAPGWLFSARYDIDAKIAETDMPRWKDPAEQRTMGSTMLQALLADRFKLVVHREMRTMPIFEMTVGKNGPKFKPTEAATLDEIRLKYPDARRLSDGSIAASGSKPGEQMFFGITMPVFAEVLRNLASRTVRDKTGLTGKYDLDYQIELLQPQSEGSGPVPPDPYSLQIHSVLEDQLGLKLTPTKGPVEVLVIDHIERPSEN